MKKTISILIILFSFSVAFSQDNPKQLAQKFIDLKGELTFTFKVKGVNELRSFSKELSIVNYDSNTKTVKAWANTKQFENFKQKGIPFSVNPSDNQPAESIGSKTTNITSYANASLSANLTFPLTGYPSYQEYADQMALFASSNPSICQLVDIGGTVEGDKRLLFVKLSDNVSTNEQEPHIMYTSSMHGDEIAGYVLMLNLIDYLITGYNDPLHPEHQRISNLLDSTEIWINPLANPDGTYHGDPDNISVFGATRANANGWDLNRNFPDNVGGPHPDGNPNYELETQHFMNLANTYHFVLSANFHGGTEVVNYPWDNTSTRHPDDDWYFLISKEYAVNCQENSPNGYMDATYFNYQWPGVTNGSDWYQVEGGRQDYMNYYHHCKETTIELSDAKLPAENTLINYWNYNQEALIAYLEQGTFGFRGVVKDAVTQEPIEAKVTLVGHDDLGSWTTTELPFGDYYRPINAGTYDLLFEADCYESFTLDNQTIADYQAIVLPDVFLNPVSGSSPSGFSASNVSSTEATLTWSATSGANYDLQYRLVGSTNWITINTPNNSFTLTGLLPSSDYEAQVRAICNTVTSNFTNILGFTTTEVSYCSSSSSSASSEYISRVQINSINNNSGPTTYSDFTSISTSLTKGEQYEITITPSWNGPTRREGYAVWIDFNGNGSFTDFGEAVLIEQPTKSTSISGSFIVPFNALENSIRMRVSMQRNSVPGPCDILNGGEVEDYSVVIEGNGPDETPPSAPTNLVASGTTFNSTNLSWNASTDNAGVVGYDVLRDGQNIGTTSNTSYQVTGLQPSTGYVFSVQAKDLAGNVSNESNTVNVTTLAPPDLEAPTAPTNLTASNTTEFTTDLSWDASTDNVGVVGYDVINGTTVIATVPTTSYQVTGLSPSSSYTFKVIAKDQAGNESAESNEVIVSTLDYIDTIPPSAPTNLSSSNITETSVDLTWNASTDNIDVTSYRVYQDGLSIGTSIATSFSVSGLTANTPYSFYVTALDAALNESNSSNIEIITTLATPTCNDGIQNGDETGIDCGGSFCEPCQQGDVTIHEGYFETGWDGWTSGGNDALYYTGSNSCEGVGSIRLRDGNGISSSMTSPTFDLSSFGEVEITFCLFSTGFSGNDGLSLSYFDGSTWSTLSSWTINTEFTDESYFTILPILMDGGLINSATNGQFRIECQASKKNTQVYIDQVIITGIGSAGAARLAGNSIDVYPNPVKDGVLNVKILNSDSTQYQIYNAYGHLVKQGEAKKEISVDELTAGFYFIEFQSNRSKIIKRFFKQ